MRGIRVVVVGVALSVVCLLGLCSPGAALAAGEASVPPMGALFHWQAQEVGTGFVEDFSSEYVVSSGPGDSEWTDYPARDLFLHDLDTGVTRQLTTSAGTEQSACLWGHKLIYMAGPHPYEAGPWSVHVYDIDSGETELVRFFQDAGSLWDLEVSDGYAAWTVNSSAGTDLWLYDFSSGISACMSNGGAHEVRDLSLADGKLAWIDGASLILYDLALKAKTIVSSGEDDSSYWVEVSGDRVAWMRGWELRVGDLGSRMVEVVSDSAEGFDLCGGTLAWTEILPAEDSMDTYEIHVMDLTEGVDRQLTSNTVPDWGVQVSDRFVMWLQGDYHGGSVLAYDLEFGGTSVVGRAAGFLLKGDCVAWYQWRGYGDVQLAAPAVFADVELEDRSGRAIEALASQAIVGGYADGTFRPSNPVLRAQFAKMLVLGLQLEVWDGVEEMPFLDVERPDGDCYPDDFVAVAFQNGIVNGFSPTRFGPYVAVTRIQMISMVVRALESLRPGTLEQPPLGWQSDFPEAQDSVHGANVRMADWNGLLTDWTPREWDMWRSATRAEMALLLWTALGGTN